MSEREWHYVHERTREGPVPESLLRARLESAELPTDVLVWSDALPDWVAANEEPAFQNVEVCPRHVPLSTPGTAESSWQNLPQAAAPKRAAKPRPKRASPSTATIAPNPRATAPTAPSPVTVSDEEEDLIAKCLEVMRQERSASTSLFQRRLRLGYTKASRLVQTLEDRGYIGPAVGARPREILIDLDALTSLPSTPPLVGIYVARNGSSHGPYSHEALVQMFSSGAISAMDHVWRDGLAGWTTVGALLGIAAPPPTVPASIAPAASAPLSPSTALPDLGGVNRSGYVGWLLGIWIVAAILSSAGMGDSALGLAAIACCFVAGQRLKNIGRNPWLALLILVPLVNLVVGIPCLIAPPNYAHTRKLDGAAKAILIVFAALVLLIIIAASS